MDLSRAVEKVSLTVGQKDYTKASLTVSPMVVVMVSRWVEELEVEMAPNLADN